MLNRRIISKKYIYILFAACITACTHEPEDVGPGNTGPQLGPREPGKVYYVNDIQPLLTSHCAVPGCHDDQTPAVNIDLSSYEGVMASMSRGELIVKPGDPINSRIYRAIKALDLVPMPPLYNYPLKNSEEQLIKEWIEQGATFDECLETCVEPDTVSYELHVKPIIQKYCTGCHYGNWASEDIELQYHFQVAEVAEAGLLYDVLMGHGDAPRMPLDKPLPQCKIDLIKEWIDNGSPNN